MMLAISSIGTLSLLDPAVLKRPPSSVSPCISLINTATSSAWSYDNSTLFLSSSQAIHRYEPSSNSLRDIYVSEDEGVISNLICLDNDTIVYSVANKVIQLQSGATPRINRTIAEMTSITSLSISNDCSLLAVTSCNAVHVHNMALGTHVVLKGLISHNPNITTSIFHPHSPTKLFLVSGQKVLIYDTIRPSGPVKTIALNETTPSNVVGIACSPFSKSLIALARSSGVVELVDLDKEKGSFRTLNLKAPLTTICFSPDGAALYLGSETGKLLILDLKALDKPPKSIIISEAGCRIETISSFQQKTRDKPSSAQPKYNIIPSSKPAGPATAPKPTMSARATRISSAASSPSSKVTPKKFVQQTEKRILTSARDPLSNVASSSPGSLGPTHKKVTPKKADQKSPILSPRSRLSSPPKESSVEAMDKPKARTILTSRKATSKATNPTSASSLLTVPTRKPSSRAHSSSSVSPAGFDVSNVSSASRPSSSASRLTPPQTTPNNTPLPPSRTPSPVLPSPNPVTPEPRKKNIPRTIRDVSRDDGQQTSGTRKENVTLDKKGKTRTVAFSDDGRHSRGKSAGEGCEPTMAVQISPQRPQTHWEASPVRQSLPTGMNPDGTSAHDLLRSIVKDAMYDFQRETRAEMMGLHLDLLRMGRGWKQELREMTREYAGAVNELTEENKRLREENERLRRF